MSDTRGLSEQEHDARCSLCERTFNSGMRHDCPYQGRGLVEIIRELQAEVRRLDARCDYLSDRLDRANGVGS